MRNNPLIIFKNVQKLNEVSKKKALIRLLGWGVKEFLDDETKILKRNVWFGGEDKNVLIKRFALTDPNLLVGYKKKNTCGNEDFWVWELFLVDIYILSNAETATAPCFFFFFFSYAFHYQGTAITKFKQDSFSPRIVKPTKSYDNLEHHFDAAFHPIIEKTL